MAALAPIGAGDSIVAAFLAGWVLRGMPHRSGPRAAAPQAGWLLCALVAGSTVAVIGEPEGVAAGTRLMLGLALSAATVRIFRLRPGISIQLPAAMVAGASAAVLLSIVRASTFDWRASAAAFGLVACCALGMCIRATGRSRIVWAAAALWLAVGVGLATARSPQMLVALSRTRPLITATIAAGATNPWFGIGIGRDRTTTPLFYPPSINGLGAATDSHNLLAIGVELGLAGLALWLIWVGAGLLRAARGLSKEPHDARLWGVSAGVAFYVAALAVSRPLAFSETLFPFVLQFGLMTALAGSVLLEATPEWTRRSRWQVVATAIAMAAIAAGAWFSARRGPPALVRLKPDATYGYSPRRTSSLADAARDH